MKLHTSLALAALLIAAFVAAPAFAEDSAVATDPAVAYDVALKALPAPSAAGGFVFEGYVTVNGTPMGTVLLAAKPGQDDGKAVWHTSDKLVLKGFGMFHETTVFDAQMRPLHGQSKEKSPREEKIHTWKVTDGGVNWTSAKVGDETTTPAAKLLAVKGPFQTAVSQFVLFARLSKHVKGSYKSSFLKADDGEFVEVTWTVGEDGMWNGVKARLAKGVRADKRKLEAAFDPTTGALLGAKMYDDSVTFEFKAGAAPDADTGGGDFYGDKATTAQQAAVQLAVALATADFDMIERVTHWPSIHEQMAAKDATAGDLGEAGIKGLLMGQFRATLTEQVKPEMVRPMLKAMAPSLKTATQADGSAIVAFGPQFRNLKITVKEIDGSWYVVKFPDR